MLAMRLRLRYNINETCDYKGVKSYGDGAVFDYRVNHSDGSYS